MLNTTPETSVSENIASTAVSSCSSAASAGQQAFRATPMGRCFVVARSADSKRFLNLHYPCVPTRDKKENLIDRFPFWKKTFLISSTGELSASREEFFHDQ